jgi:Tol biopolymer transport system component
MQYLEGETLAERLKRGPLPFEQALDLARQIASALAAAHERGIVHRDLKPSNIILTKSGVKLLDFGLAKWEERTSSLAPTEERPLTREGQLLGTIAYMAPEQLEGKEADARADIYAFGAVLYEMVTGRRVYDEERRRELSPPLLDSVVARALGKAPAERWQSARDIEILLNLPQSPVAALPPRRQRAHAHLAWASLVVLAALLAWWVRPTPQAELIRLSVTLPQGHSLYSDASPSFAISPDERDLVFASRHSTQSNTELYLRNLDSFEVQQIPGTTDARQPVFSPDGQSVAFLIAQKLAIYRISRNGGAVTRLCDTPAQPRGLAWTSEGEVLFGTEGAGIWSVPENGGTPEPVTTLASGESGHENPRPLPQNRGLLFVAVAIGGNSQVALLPPTAKEHQVLFPGASAAYLSSGHLVFGRSGSAGLFAVPFDLATSKVQGPPIQIDGTVALNANWNPQLRIGESTLIYAPGDDSRSTVVWVDREGNTELAATSDRRYHTVHLSPDGRSFAADEAGGGMNRIWVHDLARGTRGLVADGTSLQTPRFGPEEGVLSYSDFEDILLKAIDGTGDARRAVEQEHVQSEPSWSRDGSLLAFTNSHPETGEDLWFLPRGETPRPFLVTPARENAPAFSPDGRWIAYQSDVSGRPEIYAQPFPGPGARQLVSTKGGKEPVWSYDGRELFYREGTALMAVPVETAGAFRAGLAKRLFDGPYVADNTGHASYDVSPQGDKFLMIRMKKPASPSSASS